MLLYVSDWFILISKTETTLFHQKNSQQLSAYLTRK